jgi:DNA-binding transcriptional regulator YdaS (Cro superfamily)
VLLAQKARNFLKMLNSMEKGVRLAIEAGGGLREFARKLGISKQAVQQWTQVPAHRIIEIERLTGVPREKLRPDLYR